MRIIVASPPKTGNLWVKSLLAEMYHLEILDKPPATEESLREAVKSGWFKENAVFHQHFAPTPAFLEIAEATNSYLVTTIRNPYDTFVSLYYWTFDKIDGTVSRCGYGQHTRLNTVPTTSVPEL